MHPFDLRAALFAKHAQHVVLIHFPIALFIVGVAFDYAGEVSGKAALVAAAYLQLSGCGCVGGSGGRYRTPGMAEAIRRPQAARHFAAAFGPGDNFQF